ncbi:MAG: response regulator transcription factor [Aeromonadales bacterium]|nr:response regulator transcription factor [Aeromonadales bacterium]MDY2891975.1 response regulator transcription factor [Succinivibrio sp.]
MIYCVEDDTDIREIETYTLRSLNLQAEGFPDGKSFFEAVERELPELVLLDVMLPDMDGVEILRRLRRTARTRSIPVIMATAKGAEYERVGALDAGADDYLTKPFSMMEMAARVRAVLRRTRDDREDVISMGGVELNESRHEVRVGGKAVELTFKEFELLSLLMRHPGRVYSREMLLGKIWNLEYDGENRTVDVHVRNLRQKLGDKCDIIRTVRGLGYKAEEA